MSDLGYKAVVTEVKLAGAKAAFAAVVPVPGDDKEVYLQIAAIMEQDQAKRLRIGDTIDIQITFPEGS